MTKTGNKLKFHMIFEDFAGAITKFTGSATAFSSAFALIILWGISGPIFDFSDTWQMVINTTTTIVTFLMVFLIQHSQNKESVALHVKIDELLNSKRNASNYLIDSENLSEEELDILEKYYKRIESKPRKDEQEVIDKINEDRKDKDKNDKK